LEIISLNNKYSKAIAELHKDCLPNDFLTLLGEDFLIKYYNCIFDQNNSLILGRFSENNLVGVIAFCSTEWSIFQFAKSNVLFFFKKCLIAAKNLKFTVYIIEVLVLFLINKPHANFELQYIFVDRNYRQKNIGADLINYGIAEINRRQHKSFDIIVKTLKSTKENIYFYQKNGFNIVKIFCGRVWLKYNT